jgi:hypothetical protein
MKTQWIDGSSSKILAKLYKASHLLSMADRAAAKSKAQAHGKSKKKGAMDGMTVKGGHKLSVKEGAGLTAKGRESINRRTGSNLKAPAPNGKPGTKAGARKKSFCARSRGWTGERGKAARKRWNC